LALAVILVLMGFSVPGAAAALSASVLIAYFYSRHKVQQSLHASSGEDHVASPPSATPEDIADDVGSNSYTSRGYISLVLSATLCLTLLTATDIILAKHFLEPQIAGQY